MHRVMFTSSAALQKRTTAHVAFTTIPTCAIEPQSHILEANFDDFGIHAVIVKRIFHVGK